ncbi:MAG: LPD7 domain-containing protein [Burkholderia gladioli]
MRKPITTRDGYTIPSQVASRYMVKDGRFWKLDAMEGKPGELPTTKPHFEDVGSRLKTQQNDRGTIADMLAVMKAKNIDSITVKGSETFRRNAWIEASLDGGIDVKGFKPKEADFALLEAAKRERDALTIKAGASPEPAVGPNIDAKVDPATAKPSAPAVSPKPDAVPTASGAAPAAGAATKPVDTSSGELLQHGAARYENKPNESYSYFVRYRDEAGAERTVWGVDLKRAIAESGAKVGDTVSLKNLGRTPVTVQEQVRDEAGKVIGTRPKETIRNAWEVTRSAAPEPERTPAPARVQLTVAQMREQLEKSLEQAPARMRGEVMRRFDARMQAGVEVGARIARGELSRDAGAAEIDKRATELHAAWTAPKAAPTSQPSNSPQHEQQQARGPTPSVM